jgi:hypothetical protein
VRAAFETEEHRVAPVDIVMHSIAADTVAKGGTAFEIELSGKAHTEMHRLWEWLRKDAKQIINLIYYFFISILPFSYF